MQPDRHGRALRTPPDARRRPDHGFRMASRRRFEALLRDVLPTLPAPVSAALHDVTVEHRDVPGTATPDGRSVPLVELRVGAGRAQVLVVHRRALELRALSRGDLAELLRVEIVRTAAEALHLELGEEWDDLDEG